MPDRDRTDDRPDIRSREGHADLDALDRLVEAELSSLIAGLKRRARPPRPMSRPAVAPRPAPLDGLLDPDEAAFLDGAVAWLRGRPNVDILLDALGRRVLDPDGAKPLAKGSTDPARPAQDPAAPGDVTDAVDAMDAADGAAAPAAGTFRTVRSAAGPEGARDRPAP